MNRSYRRDYLAAILPVGRVNPAIGECEYFNIYQTWSNSTVEIFKNEKGNLRFVCTAGKSDMTRGETRSFRHDQRFYDMGTWTFLEAHSMEVFKKSGLKSAPMYTYK